MIGNHVDYVVRQLKIVTPSFESFEDCQQPLVVHVVIQLGAGKSPAVEGDWVNIAVIIAKQKYPGDRIIGGVSLNNRIQCRVEMSKNGSRCKSSLEEGKGLLAGSRPIPQHILVCKAGEGHHHVRIVDDETPIKIGESQERLDILDAARNGPVLDDLHFRFGHVDAVRVNNKT